MNKKEFVEALLGAADGDAADNEPKRDVYNDAELLRDGFATFNHQYDFKRGMIVGERSSCSLLRKRGKSSASVRDRYQSSVALAEAWRPVYPVPDMTSFLCPYLGGEVQLSGEREAHIAERHPDLLPEHRERIGTTLADPDQVRRSRRFGAAKLFSRWFSDVKGGKHVVVVVVSSGGDGRHWIIRAYITRKLAEGEVEWARS